MTKCDVCLSDSEDHASWCPEVAARTPRAPTRQNPFTPREATGESNAALERLRNANNSYLLARETMLRLRAQRDVAIYNACNAGCTQSAVGMAAHKPDGDPLKREQVRLIRDAVEAGNAGQEPKPRPRRRRVAS